ncbi:hypothetical protein Tco_0233232 [Tanacetum coccineum]
MAEYSQKWHNGTSKGRSNETSDGLAAIQAQLNNLGREIKKVNENFYAAQVEYEQCKGPHYTKDYLQKEEGKTYEEAYYTQGGASMQVAIRNQGASIKTLEIQIRKMSKDVKVPLMLIRPFLSTARAKIDVYKRKITLTVGEEKIIFRSVKPASSLIKRACMLSLRERTELDLEARLMGETLELNKSLDPFSEDYIELYDLNEPFELRRNQGYDLMPTIKEGEDWCSTLAALLGLRNSTSEIVVDMLDQELIITCSCDEMALIRRIFLIGYSVLMQFETFFKCLRLRSPVQNQASQEIWK